MFKIQNFILIVLFIVTLQSSFMKKKLLSSTYGATCGSFGNLVTNSTGSSYSEVVGNIANMIGYDTSGEYVKSTCYTYTGSLNVNNNGAVFSDCSCFVAYLLHGVDNEGYFDEISYSFLFLCINGLSKQTQAFIT